MNNALAKLLCKVILPALTIYMLLIIPNKAGRNLFLDSSIIDWGVRIMFAIWFSYNYWQLPGIFSNKEKLWLGNHLILESSPGIFFIFIVGLHSFGAAIFTYFSVVIFLPMFKDFRIVLSVLNGFFFIIAMSIQYHTYKEIIQKHD